VCFFKAKNRKKKAWKRGEDKKERKEEEKLTWRREGVNGDKVRFQRRRFGKGSTSAKRLYKESYFRKLI
jgi:hypothetical protein